jgi:hypothetical protein
MNHKIIFDSRRENELYKRTRIEYQGASPNEDGPSLDAVMNDASSLKSVDIFNDDGMSNEKRGLPPSQALEMQGILSSYFTDMFHGSMGMPVMLSKWPEPKRDNKLVCKGPIRRKNGRPLPEDNLMMKFSFK